MEGELSQPNRSSRRLTPRKPVTVAFQDGETSLAYGVVTNISETGARIVWSGKERGTFASLPSAVLQGVQFTQLTDRELGKLRQLLDSPDFVAGEACSVTPEFEDLVSALRQDLGRLGTKLRQVT